MKANNLAEDSTTETTGQSLYAHLKYPLDTEAIKKIIPHRYPFFFVDEVLEVIPGVSIVGIKHVRAEEPHFQGHFPGRPIMPGVLMLEALAQLGAIFAKITLDRPVDNTLIVFSAADKVRFRRLVVPGDTLRLEMKLARRKRNVWKMEGTASVNDEVAVDAVFSASEIV